MIDAPARTASVASLGGVRAGRRLSTLLDGRPDLQRAYEHAESVARDRAEPIEFGAWEEAVLALLERNLGAPTILAFLHVTERWPAQADIGLLAEAGQAAARIGREAGGAAARAVIAVMPAIRRRLDDNDEVALVLAALERLAGEAPDALALVAPRLDRLLSHTDVAGLEAWLIGGLRAGGDDLRQRRAYFALEDPLSLRLLALGGQDSDFARLERRLEATFPLLWGLRVPIRPLRAIAGQGEARRATFVGGLVRFPERFAGVSGDAAADLYRAAAAHIGAHLALSRVRFPVGSLKPLQVALVSLIEDARVERLAMEAMPGLRSFWAPFHTARPDGPATALALFARLARALFDPSCEDNHNWIVKARRLFGEAGSHGDPQISRRIGGLLGNDLGQMRVQFNPRTYVVEPAYRDDNAGLWDFGDVPDAATEEIAVMLDSVRIERRDEEGDRDGEGDERDPWEEANRARSGEATTQEGLPVAIYPEWDHTIARERADWTTIVEVPVRHAAPAVADVRGAVHAEIASRVEALARAASIGRRVRQKRRIDGETLDIDAAIAAMIEQRAARTPDPRVHLRDVPGPRDLAVLILIDASQSTADKDDTSRTILAVEQEAATIVGQAVAKTGDAVAVHGFCSDGRDKVFYTRLKDFEEPFDAVAEARIAGLASGFSTRLGAAIRHAGASLSALRAFRRVLLLLTDGEPSDIDIADPDYLVDDARHACRSLRKLGVDVFAFGLGVGPFAHLGRIVGARNTLHVSRIDALPLQLMQVYIQLKR